MRKKNLEGKGGKMRVKKKIAIQAYWGADIKTVKGSPGLSLEEVIKKHPIVVCSVIIDDEVVGDVTWDGKRLAIKYKMKDWKCPDCGHRFKAKEPPASIPVSVIRCPKCDGIAESMGNNEGK